MRVAILGAGISGLSLGWYLKQRFGSKIDLSIYEKSGRAGGLIQTIKSDNFLWELGPRSCRTKGKGKETLALIEGLGLQNEVISPQSSAKNRFVYDGKRLVRLPRSLWELPFNSLTKGWLQALFRDVMHPKSNIEDESIYNFFSRRLGIPITENLIDPFVSGIFAGDSRRLSIKSCFPLFAQWQEKYGSLIVGAFKHHPYLIKETPFIKKMKEFPLFSLREGMESLTHSLAAHLRDALLLNQTIDQIKINKETIYLFSQGREASYDLVISTLPCYALSPLLKEFPQIEKKLNEVSYASLTIVHMVFKGNLLPFSGFGYLVPSRLKQNILGCVTDSSIFAEHQRGEQTRLTFMLGGSMHPQVEALSDEEIIEISQKALRDHMEIEKKPEEMQIHRNLRAIPQFDVGHEGWKRGLEEELKKISPKFCLSGTAFSGVSINDCISHARQTVQHFSFSNGVVA